MHVFRLCVYSFVLCWSPLGVFGAHVALLGADFGPLFGSLWGALIFQRLKGPLGVTLASLWPPFGPLGTPWDHLGHLGIPSGAWDDLGSKMDVLFRANGPQVRRLRIKRDLAELTRGSPGSEQSTQSVTGAAAPNPTSLAPGARMT